MAASLYVGDDTGGWIGDLTEFAWELKNNGITEKEDAAARFLSADSYWNEADFYADIDAANMRKTYQRNTLSETLLTYYGKDTIRQRNIWDSSLRIVFSRTAKKSWSRRFLAVTGHTGLRRNYSQHLNWMRRKMKFH